MASRETAGTEIEPGDVAGPVPGPTGYVAFDLETTGLSAESDRIVEIGAVRFDAAGMVLGEFQRLVNPLRPSGPQARAVHGISDAELALAEKTNEDKAETMLDEVLAS